MKSEWRVTSNIIGGVKMYAVYRLRNVDGIDQSGNREYYGNYMEDRNTAKELAESLNVKYDYQY